MQFKDITTEQKIKLNELIPEYYDAVIASREMEEQRNKIYSKLDKLIDEMSSEFEDKQNVTFAYKGKLLYLTTNKNQHFIGHVMAINDRAIQPEKTHK